MLKVYGFGPWFGVLGHLGTPWIFVEFAASAQLSGKVSLGRRPSRTQSKTEISFTTTKKFFTSFFVKFILVLFLRFFNF